VQRLPKPFAAAILTAAACAFHPLTAQGPLPLWPMLPKHRVAEVGSAVSGGRILDAIRAALNSPGDTIVLEVEASLSAALIAVVNVGQSQSLEVEVKRTASGYEATLSLEDARTCGLEAYEGLEINAGLGSEKTVVFGFASADVTASTLQTLALARAVRLGESLPLAWANYLSHQAQRQAAEAAAWAAFQARMHATQVLSACAVAYYEATQALDFFGHVLTDASAAYVEASAALEEARRELEESKLPDWLKGPLRWALSTAQSAFDAAYRAYTEAVASWNSASAALSKAVADLNAANDDWERKLAREEEKTREWQEAIARQDEAHGLWEALSSMQDVLARHLVAIEFQVQRVSDLSAVLTVPGISLSNLGIGFYAATQAGVRIRYERPLSDDQRIVLSGVVELATTAHAGALIGGVGSSTCEFGVHASFVQNGGIVVPAFGGGIRILPVFQFEKVETDVQIDLQALALAGTGWSAAHGVGRRIEIVAPEATLRAAIDAVPAFAQDPTLATLITALRPVQGGVMVADRWIAGGVAQFGLGILGYGASAGGSVTWNDEGSPWYGSVGLGDLLEDLTDPAQVEGALQRLWAARR